VATTLLNHGGREYAAAWLLSYHATLVLNFTYVKTIITNALNLFYLTLPWPSLICKHKQTETLTSVVQ